MPLSLYRSEGEKEEMKSKKSGWLRKKLKTVVGEEKKKERMKGVGVLLDRENLYNLVYLMMSLLALFYP